MLVYYNISFSVQGLLILLKKRFYTVLGQS